MTALTVNPPFPVYTDIDGQPLEDGYIYIGTPNLPPITNPIATYWDAALTQPAAQPIRTRGGYPVNSGTPARIYIDGVSYSIQVLNKNGAVIYTEPSGSGISPDSSGISFIQAGTGAVTRTVQSKLRDYVSTSDFGIPGDMTDDGQNHVRLANAAKQAIIARKGLIIDGTVLVSDTVNWDTTQVFYNNTDPNIPNGVAKLLSIKGNNSGDGIYAKASAFSNQTKDVITLRV